jgi:hypothetical protein
MKWKCKLTGNIIELPDWEEDSMVGHDQYERVVEEALEQPTEFKSKLSYRKPRSHKEEFA